MAHPVKQFRPDVTQLRGRSRGRGAVSFEGRTYDVCIEGGRRLGKSDQRTGSCMDLGLTRVHAGSEKIPKIEQTSFVHGPFRSLAAAFACRTLAPSLSLPMTLITFSHPSTPIRRIPLIPRGHPLAMAGARNSNIALQKQSERTSQKREAREEMITKRMGLGGGPGNRADGSRRHFVGTHAQFVGEVFSSDSMLTHSSSH